MSRKVLLLSVAIFLSEGIFGQYSELQPATNYGGKSQWLELISMAMEYPESARSEKIEGKVQISAIVSTQGEVSQIEIIQSVNPALDKEAIRLFRHLLWEPASFRGIPTESRIVLEVDFNLRKYQRWIKKRGYDLLPRPSLPVDTSMKVYKVSQLTQTPVPIYPSPINSFPEFVMKNLVYPSAAVKQNISGTVELFFVVEPFGKVTNIKVLKSVPGGCNEEAIRLLKMINWNPGIKDGLAVRTGMTMSVTFNLADYEKLRYVPAGNTNQF